MSVEAGWKQSGTGLEVELEAELEAESEGAIAGWDHTRFRSWWLGPSICVAGSVAYSRGYGGTPVRAE